MRQPATAALLLAGLAIGICCGRTGRAVGACCRLSSSRAIIAGGASLLLVRTLGLVETLMLVGLLQRMRQPAKAAQLLAGLAIGTCSGSTGRAVGVCCRLSGRAGGAVRGLALLLLLGLLLRLRQRGQHGRQVLVHRLHALVDLLHYLRARQRGSALLRRC